MKKLIFFTLVICAPILAFAGGGSDDWDFGFPKRGNGNLVTFEKPLSQFEKLQISGRAIVNFYESREYRAVVTVDSNLQEGVRIYIDNDVLKIGTKNGRSYIFTQYIVDVYCPRLSGISISGSVRFEGKDKINSPSFNLNISGVGKITGAFECSDFSATISGSADINSRLICNSLKAGISGSGKITLAGETKDLDITVSGSGDFIGHELCANNAALQISGSANINIWVMDYLKANVSGSGLVRYRGNPKIEYRASGSGRFENVEL